MPRWRVGPGGLLVTNRDGVIAVLEEGTVLDAVPLAYDGKLEVIELDVVPDPPKRLRGYADKRIRSPEDK